MALVEVLGILAAVVAASGGLYALADLLLKRRSRKWRKKSKLERDDGQWDERIANEWSSEHYL